MTEEEVKLVKAFCLNGNKSVNISGEPRRTIVHEERLTLLDRLSVGLTGKPFSAKQRAEAELMGVARNYWCADYLAEGAGELTTDFMDLPVYRVSADLYYSTDLS